MKKTILLLVLVLGVGVGAFFWFHRQGHYRAVDILPETTILFLQTSDSGMAREKISKSAFGKIGNEPEIRQFLKQPLQSVNAKLHDQREAVFQVQGLAELFNQAEGESFLAVTDVSISPDLDVEILAGFDPGPKRAKMEAAVEAWVKRYRVEFPSQELEERREQSIRYHVLREGNHVRMAYGRLGNFLILSRGESAFKKVITCAKDRDARTLGKSPAFSVHMNPKGDSDTVFFINVQSAWAGLQMLTPIQAVLKSQAAVPPFQSLYGSTRFLENGVEDHVWTVFDPAGAQSTGLSDMKVCERRSLKGAGQDTLLYAAAGLDVGAWLERNYRELKKSGVGKWSKELDALEQVLESKQIHPREDLLAHLGPEVSLSLEWGAAMRVPSLHALVECHDPEKVKSSLQGVWAALNEISPGSLGNMEELPDENGNSLLQVPGPYSLVRPTIAFHEGWMIFALEPSAVTRAIGSLKGLGGHLADNKSFQSVEARFEKGYSQFIYCDEKELFERTYNLLSGLAMLAKAMAPKVQEQVDLTRLPQTAPISRHLGPAVCVVRVDGNGTHQSAFGPVNPSVMTGIQFLMQVALLGQPPESSK